MSRSARWTLYLVCGVVAAFFAVMLYKEWAAPDLAPLSTMEQGEKPGEIRWAAE